MSRPSANWSLLPTDWVTHVEQERAELIQELLGVPLLLVRLFEPDDELTGGLIEASRARGERLGSSGALGFSTAVGTHDERAGSGRRSRSERRGPSWLALQLSQSPYFVVPLRKRPLKGKPFSARISVGRAVNNNVVLRHPSVSKFHAWFECDDDGVFYVCDARSTNTTKLNGQAVGREPEALHGGDQIVFGSVAVLYSPADLLWDAFHHRT